MPNELVTLFHSLSAADNRQPNLRIQLSLRTWASWLTQNGVPLNVIQEMGAWQSVEMVRRYAHLAPEQFGQHAKVVDELLNGTFTSQAS